MSIPCRHCGEYPASKPTAGLVAYRGTEVLLVRRGIEPQKGMWDIPGGFLEKGEHPEAGAIREFKEETGLDAIVDGFLCISMDCYGPEGKSTQNTYYRGSVVGGEIKECDESIDVRWFDISNIPPLAFQNCVDAMKKHIELVFIDSLRRTSGK